LSREKHLELAGRRRDLENVDEAAILLNEGLNEIVIASLSTKRTRTNGYVVEDEHEECKTSDHLRLVPRFHYFMPSCLNYFMTQTSTISSLPHGLLPRPSFLKSMSLTSTLPWPPLYPQGMSTMPSSNGLLQKASK
jgi:hypothetical protein